MQIVLKTYHFSLVGRIAIVFLEFSSNVTLVI